VVSGFEPADLLQAIYHAVLQLEKGEYKVENCYERLVKEEGNVPAQNVVNEIFEIGEQEWRGIGKIPESGLVMKEKYAEFDASRKFDISNSVNKQENLCIAGEILKGIKKPVECPQFGKTCNPNPLAHLWFLQKELVLHIITTRNFDGVLKNVEFQISNLKLIKCLKYFSPFTQD
jgi:hydrogenase expression/formation protein HypD